MTDPTPPEAKPSALTERERITVDANEATPSEAFSVDVRFLCHVIRRLDRELCERDARIKRLEAEVQVERTVKNARTAGFRSQLADLKGRISEAVEKLRKPRNHTPVYMDWLNDVADYLEGKTK